MIEILRGAIAVILTFSFAIFIHELGHFMFAKLFKVRVETFSIGFGKKLWSRRRGETEYAISAIPFGGYVKLVGMHSKEMEAILDASEKPAEKSATEGETVAVHGGPEPGQIPAETALREAIDPAAAQSGPINALGDSVVEELDALRSKPWWQKMLIFAAGCMNNFLTAAMVFFLLAWIGHYRPEPGAATVDMVQFVQPQVAGVQEGDTIVEFVGKPINDYQEFQLAYLDFIEKNPEATAAAVKVKRGDQVVGVEIPTDAVPDLPAAGERIVAMDGKPLETPRDVERAAVLALMADRKDTVSMTLEKDGVQRTEVVLAVAALGKKWPIYAINYVEIPYVYLPIPNLPADRAGMKMGDVITSINGKPVATAERATRILQGMAGQTAKIEALRTLKDGTKKTLAFDVEVRSNPDTPQMGQIGVSFTPPPTTLHKLPFGEALVAAFKKTGDVVVSYIQGVKQLFGSSSFQTIRENIGGPIMIGTMFYRAANESAVYFFSLFAFFNIILAVTNLLPLPVFDGGHIVITTIEAIIRRPLPARAMMLVFNVFIVLIIGLALLISVNDVVMNWWRLL